MWLTELTGTPGCRQGTSAPPAPLCRQSEYLPRNPAAFRAQCLAEETNQMGLQRAPSALRTRLPESAESQVPDKGRQDLKLWGPRPVCARISSFAQYMKLCECHGTRARVQPKMVRLLLHELTQRCWNPARGASRWFQPQMLQERCFDQP